MLQPLKSLVDYLSPGANKLTVVADIDARVSFYSESPISDVSWIQDYRGSDVSLVGMVLP